MSKYFQMLDDLDISLRRQSKKNGTGIALFTQASSKLCLHRTGELQQKSPPMRQSSTGGKR